MDCCSAMIVIITDLEDETFIHIETQSIDLTNDRVGFARIDYLKTGIELTKGKCLTIG